MINYATITDFIVVRLVRYRWFLAALMSIVTVVHETIQHKPHILGDLTPHFVGDVTLYGIFLPIATVIVLALVAEARSSLMSTQISALESERRNMARELHDSVGQYLGLLHLKLDLIACGEVQDEGMRRDLEQARGIADEAYTEVRRVLSSLQPDLSANLATNMHQYVEMHKRWTDLDIHVTTEGASRWVPPAAQQGILYIVREALSNIEKHAHAHQADIHLRWSADNLTVQVTDDGCGFEPGAAPHSGHFGLAFMQERAAEIDGQLFTRSHPGAGTQLTLRLPLAPSHSRAAWLRDGRHGQARALGSSADG